MQVSKWGNSLAIRLPASVVKALELHEGDDIEVMIADERVFQVKKKPGNDALHGYESFEGNYPPTSRLTETMQMLVPKAFIDSNVLLYLLSDDADKANRAEAIVRAGGLISVQVLNEIASVARRKLAMSWAEINEVLTLIQSICLIEPLTIEIHDRGRLVAEQYRLNVYDATIVAAALLTGCKTLYSEDMQNGLLIGRQLHICNPFTT